MLSTTTGYDWNRSYEWNYDNVPHPVSIDVKSIPGTWDYCGLPVDSPLGIPAGPLLNGKWILYYASLGFDVLTYKTVRSTRRACYAMPNLQPVTTKQLVGIEKTLPARDTMEGTWAVSFGMPSREPDVWRKDIEETRNQLPSGKLLPVSVVGTVQDGWTTDQLAEDYATCAKWAVDSGADCVEANLSCPNVDTCDGQLFQNPSDAARVAMCVKDRIGSVPFIVKVGKTDGEEAVTQLLKAISAHVDAVALTNSIATTVVNDHGDLLFDGNRRGICGGAIREASIQQTALFRRVIERDRWDVKLIGVGGVSSARHVHEYLDAGAHAVQLATSAMVNPDIGRLIRDQF